jgi:hypothetical protein
MAYLILFGIPILLGLIVFVFMHKSITVTELMIQMLVQAAIAGISVAVIYHQNVDDVQVFNSHVTGKHRQTVPCDHTYSCDCHLVPYDCSTTDSKGNRESRTCYRNECDTCYEHSSSWSRKSPGDDYDWLLTTSMGHNIEIRRVNRRGDEMPPRYDIAQVNDPVAETATYENYIKAAPDTLFQRRGLVAKFNGQLMPYPSNVYDYHYLDRIVGNYKPNNLAEWQFNLSVMNSHLQQRKANVVLVLLKDKPQDFAYALEQHWVGGKKNDAIVLINTNDGINITWSYVMSWTKNELYKVLLRDHINELGVMELDKLIPLIEKDTLEMFEHRSMKDFEYLMSSITPTTSQWTWSMVIGLVFSIAMSFLFAHPDVDISITNMRNNRRRYY